MEPRWRLNRRRWWSAKHCWPSIMDASNSSGWRTHKSSSGELTSSSSWTATVFWLTGYLLLPLFCSSSVSSRPDRRCFRVMAGRIFSLTSHTVDNKTSELSPGTKTKTKQKQTKRVKIEIEVFQHNTPSLKQEAALYSATSSLFRLPLFRFSSSLPYHFFVWNVLMLLIWRTFFYFLLTFISNLGSAHGTQSHKVPKYSTKFSNGSCVCVCVWPGWKVRHEFRRLYL